jgi:hypothetical protein
MEDQMSTSENPAYRVLNTNSEARESIALLIASAEQELMIFDRTPITLRERGLGRPEITEKMRSMLLGGKYRKIRIALHEVQSLESELPRLVSLLGHFGGQVMIHRVTGAARQVEDVLFLADEGSVWRKPVYSHPRSVVHFGDKASAKPYLERFEEIWSSSELAVTDRQAGL